MSRYPSLEERFAERWTPEPFSGCHLWMGGCTHKGYGSIQGNGKNLYAHRLSWEMNKGAIPDGLQVLHRCDTPMCVNPDHLFLGTSSDNSIDMARKGRNRHPRYKLTNKEINSIRVASGTQSEIAGQFGVSQSHVSRIVNKERRQYI